MHPSIEPKDEAEAEKEEKKPGPSAKYWISQIEAANQAAKDSWANAKTAFDEFTMHGKKAAEGEARDESARFPQYFSCVKSMQPMLYSRTPIPVAEKLFDDLPDNIARLACLSLERLAKYLIRGCDFDRVMMLTRDTFIHAGKCAPRVRCESVITDDPVKIYYQQQQVLDPETQQPLVIWINEAGEVLEGEVELLQDDKGRLPRIPR